MNFKNIWTSYEDWVKEHVNNDDYMDMFYAPAKQEEISSLEKKLALDLPLELKTFFLTHNGIDDLKFIYGADEFFSIEKVYQYWLEGNTLLEDEIKYIGSSISNSDELNTYNKKNNQDYYEEYSKGIKWLPFSKKWIPFMSFNGGSYIWYIDFDPDKHGIIGQIIQYYPEGGEARVVSVSYLAFLKNNLEKLKEGDYVFDSYGNLVKVNDLLEIENDITRNEKINEELSSNIKFNQIEKLSEGDSFTFTGLITCEDHFMNEIEQYRASLKKTAFIERARLKVKELSTPKLSEGECFILIGNNHLILKKPSSNELSELSFEKVVKVNVKVLEGSRYQILEYEILK